MKAQEFTKRVASIMPQIHIEIVKRQPQALLTDKITLPQMVIINLLFGRSECKMTDISRVLGVTKSAVTGIIDRLIRLGLIKRMRSKDDRRIVNVMLTPKGITYARKLVDFRYQVIRRLFSNLSHREKAQYLRILTKIHDNIRARANYEYYG